MSKPLSVLQRATKADVRSEPFPHIILRDALPLDLYQELAGTFPAPETLEIDTRRNNTRWDYEAHRVRSNEAVPQIWRDFIAYHVSQAFFGEVADLFYDDIHKFYPDYYPNYERLKNMKAGIRFSDTYATRDILMDAMLSGNTPVTNAGSVRTSHIDNGDKLFSGLFYMRPEDYDAVGGDLTISRFQSKYATLKAKATLFNDAYVDDTHLECVETVQYDKNILVLFINSIESVHGVTVRQPTNKSRLFVNLVGEVEKPFYIKGKKIRPRYVPAHQNQDEAEQTWLKKLKQKLRL
ncbi:hypothetical protein EN962_24305 [Mesorhizobium sp. M7A.F.Ca.CA.001.09.2.1]|uniref:2OG-Fe(II) oxygenase n=1 Tax=Mesorhizobium ciceri TaxID=39645 RepID=A0AB38T8Z8_9HYPH|nr:MULTISPECIES: hypothetical protein [Mesorhizobium]RUY57604.1 hypothetical protein EN981_03775 [Mesorhizobium sp. M7A.F.Ca.CA.001.13.2.1]MDF3215971.1 hypothetical protein [Mesorhizobium ciceri]RUY63660.1 hypothetical protein EN980_27395 [Mesorhizobium sp. M7A.F.Ca.CA.001.13.1.1]RUY70477.1 hypothetical protein EN965_09960 [Mesorhizobium sp. M7A.F.Ca.CA.001.05.1.1]RUY75174.1 hypothetical protein EN962_24305 [Mesorhizobium sp. M7A.F.Ca.CA.001.09.2.1]